MVTKAIPKWDVCALKTSSLPKYFRKNVLHKSLWRPTHTKILFTESKTNDLGCQDINHSLEIAHCECQVITMG